MRLKDKITIVTGAGSGIGRAIASMFASEGARVVVADINDPGGNETVNIIKQSGGEACFIHTDVSQTTEVQNLIKETVKKYQRIDTLVNNAGMFMPRTSIDATEEAFWDRIFSVNVKSIFLTTKYAIPIMKQTGGSIINIASSMGVRPLPNAAAYSSSKGAVITLTKAVALELAPYRIRVNCITPMITNTPMIKLIPEEIKIAASQKTPQGRLAEPEDMAYGALYLASDESIMVTGLVLEIDGGRNI